MTTKCHPYQQAFISAMVSGKRVQVLHKLRSRVIMTPSEQNDAIRAQVEREIPTPAGGFETEDAKDEHKAKQEARFFELVRALPINQ